MSMTNEHLVRHFERIGARLRIDTIDGPSRRLGRDRYRFDLIEGRRQGQEVFNLIVGAHGGVEPLVLNADPAERALLLMLKLPGESGGGGERGDGRGGGGAAKAQATEKHRYLCGHDERAWFIAAVPRQRGVVDVGTARDALKPAPVLASQFRSGTKRKDWHRRHNPGFLRQGEWFFLPAEGAVPTDALILRNEPIRRGGGKPHRVEELCRTGGVTVHVSRLHPNGVTTDRYRELIRQDPKLKRLPWQVMTRDALVYARGRVTHADHATLPLPGWHQILSNTESAAPFVRNLAFLD